MKRVHPSRKLGDFSSRKVCSNKYAVKPNKASITKRDDRIEIEMFEAMFQGNLASSNKLKIIMGGSLVPNDHIEFWKSLL